MFAMVYCYTREIQRNDFVDSSLFFPFPTVKDDDRLTFGH